MTLLNFYNYNENSLWHILLKEKYTTNSINKPIKNIHIYLKKYYTSLYFKQFKINFNNYQNNKLNHNNSEKYKYKWDSKCYLDFELYLKIKYQHFNDLSLITQNYFTNKYIKNKETRF